LIIDPALLEPHRFDHLRGEEPIATSFGLLSWFVVI
jgi:hypothetical protein